MLRDTALIPLSHQHQHALALCVQIDRASASVAIDDGGLAILARTIVNHFESEMRTHFLLEEQVVFPAMSKFDTTRELLSVLVEEHRRMEVLCGNLTASADNAAIAEFSAILRSHVRKEEGVLFEEAQRLLTREELDTIGKLIRPGL